MTSQATPATTTQIPPVLHTPGGPGPSISVSAPRSPHAYMTPVTSPTQNPSPGSPRHQSGTVDVESMLRNHGGDLKRTLDTVAHERNNLQAQNTQLWKLIEKQRAQCAHLAADNDRLRTDRERANARLVAAGLDPVTPVNRRGVPSSSSAAALNRVEVSERRQYSDHDEKSSTASHTNIIIRPPPTESSSLAPSALPPPSDSSPGGLLPSPMPERRLRHESRMQFPPEVASMLALADTKESPPINATLSPGPSLGTDLTNSPLSSSSERASPVVDQQQQVVAEPHQLSEELMSSSPRPSQDTVISRPSIAMHPESRPSIDSAVNATTYQQAPAAAAAADHTLFNAALLPHTHLSIPHSTVFANQHGRDILCFIISVNVRPPNSAPPLSWTVGKTFSGFMDLDQRLQERAGKTRKEWKKIVSPLPEGKAWKDFAPSKVDQRKHALEVYLESLLVAPISDKTDLCNFLTTDTVQAKAAKSRKEGFLAKKGKTPFGWKTRYFVLDGSLMKYYESRGGPLLGSIVITGAQIGRQYRSQDSSDDRNSRHAFLIIEAARKDSSQARHVLCASSDAERDSWIDMLVQQVDPEPVQSASQAAAAARRRSAMPRKPSKDVVVTSAQPMSLYPDANAKFISGAPLPSVINHMESQRQLHCSGQQASTSPPGQPGTSPQPSHPLGLVSNPAASSSDLVGPLPSAAEPTPKPIKRSSALPGRQSFSPAYLTKLSNDGVGSVPGYNVERDRDRKAKSGRFWGFGKPAEKTASKPVFGVPLTDSIAIASVAGLPAIVFRCIEYLEAKHADQEEGIYRLSGSSAVIKGLKDRFNQEGDVNLLAIDERWDPHAIAGLLKTYLRELPTSLLTRELHMRFLAVIDLIDPAARVTELFRLVAELPPANYALLRAFTAHLILIVRNSAVNKMTLRNIGIVFSPTLGIPAGIFYELVSRFGAIFDDDAGADDLPLDDPAITGTVATSVEGGVAASPASSDAHADLAPPVTGKGKRNSMLYHASGAEAMLGLAGRTLDPAAEDDTSELSIDDLESEPVSVQSSDNLSTLATQPSQADGANAAPAGTRRQAAYGTPSPNDGVEALQPSAQLAAPLQMGRNGSIGNGTM